MLALKNIYISINGVPILQDLTFSIGEGETVAILGQNGQGKSSLLKSIMGHSEYEIYQGKLLLNMNDITKLGVTERAKKGFFLANQTPIEIQGITMLEYFKTIKQQLHPNMKILEMYNEINGILKLVELNEEVLTRAINDGFSGGEKKKSEIAQMLLLNPDFIMLDEIDSGLDADSFKIIMQVLQQKQLERKTIIFITHSEAMIDALKPTKVIVLANQTIATIGDFKLAKQVLTKGYKKSLNSLGIKINQKSEKLDSCIGKKNDK